MHSTTDTFIATDLATGSTTPVQFFQHGADSPHLVAPVFAEITLWPDLDRILAETSKQLIKQRGVNEWSLAGGILRPNGRPSFAIPSAPAFRVLRDLIAERQCFRYSDNIGTQWAVIVFSDGTTARPAWRGISIGVNFSIELFDPSWRHKYLRWLSTRIDQLTVPARTATPESDQKRAQFSAQRQRVQLIDTALRLIPVLRESVEFQGNRTVRVSAERLIEAARDDEHWHSTVDFEGAVFESISVLSKIRTQLLEIPKTGWCPTPLQCGVAVQRVRRLRGKEFSVRLDPVFLWFLDHWLASDDVQLRPSTLPRLSQPINEGAQNG